MEVPRPSQQRPRPSRRRPSSAATPALCTAAVNGGKKNRYLYNLEQERLATVCGLCESGGCGPLCVPHEQDRLAVHVAKECEIGDPEARKRLEKALWDPARAIGDFYLEDFATLRAKEARLALICPECDPAGTGALCEEA